jgi:hypothetical protein
MLVRDLNLAHKFGEISVNYLKFHDFIELLRFFSAESNVHNSSDQQEFLSVHT